MKKWVVKVDKEGIEFTKMTKHGEEKLQVERAWCILHYRDAAQPDNINELIFYSQAGLETVMTSTSGVTLNFVNENTKYAEVICGKEVIPLNKIIRLNFFAQLGHGCFVASWIKSGNPHELPFILGEVHDQNTVAIVQSLVQAWIREISGI